MVAPLNNTATQPGVLPSDIFLFNDVEAFKRALQENGVKVDVSPLLSLYSNFMGPADGHLVLNVKHFDTDEPNNLLVLNQDRALLYSKSPPATEALLALETVFSRPYGKSTALAFATLKKGVANYRAKLESLYAAVKALEQDFDSDTYHQLVLEYQRLFDRLEDFHGILIDLQETGIREVETRFVSFDYKVLLAESNNLLDRCRNRLSMLKDLARDRETEAANELNKRIERLNDVVKKLTAVTVLLMIPTLIASHFGMNFVHMPELNIAWVYPAVVGAQVVLIAAGYFVFRRIGWL